VIPPRSTSYRECIDLSRQADARPSPIEAQLDDDDDADLSGRSWEDRLSRKLPNTAKSTGITACSPSTTKAFQRRGVGRNTKDQYQVAPSGKDIVYVHLANPGVEILDFEWDNHGAAGKSVLSEKRRTIAKSRGAMFLQSAAKHPVGWSGSEPKDEYNLHRQEE
jgi:hypothetical protein